MNSPSRRFLANARNLIVDHLRGSADGITMAIFAIALIVLLGFVALGIDGSRIFDERREAQNAADHAAIAAAYASCTTDMADVVTVALAAGYASADLNGYDDNETTNDVEIEVAPGAATGDHEYRATVETTIQTTFSKVIGFGQLDTRAEAIALASGCDFIGNGDSPGAIYAGGTCPTDKFGFESPGSTQRVFGGVHTNSNARVGGGSNHFTEVPAPDDPFTYVGTLASGSTGNGNLYQTGYPQDVGPAVPSPQWVSGWDPGMITGGSGVPTVGSFLRPYYDLAIANGTSAANDTFFTNEVTSITKDGVYYTTSAAGFNISSVTGSVRDVVLIAPNGLVNISSGVDNKTFNAFSHPDLPKQGLLMLSNFQKPAANFHEKKCDEYTIKIPGSNASWNGIIWAPGGLVEMSGSTNSSVNGSIVAWGVRLNGSTLTIRFNSDLFPAEVAPDVVLLQ